MICPLYLPKACLLGCWQDRVARSAQVWVWIVLQLPRRCVDARTSKVHLRFRSVVEVSIKHLLLGWCDGDDSGTGCYRSFCGNQSCQIWAKNQRFRESLCLHHCAWSLTHFTGQEIDSVKFKVSSPPLQELAFGRHLRRLCPVHTFIFISHCVPVHLPKMSVPFMSSKQNFVHSTCFLSLLCVSPQSQASSIRWDSRLV